MISKNQIKQIQSLHLKKNRDSNGLFLAEGIKVVKELLENKSNIIRELYLTTNFVASHHVLLEQKKVRYYEVTEQELKLISLQDKPNNALAVCTYLDAGDLAYNFKDSFSLYLDDVRDPGNFGTIIRLADWYGIKKVFCSETSCDLYNPKVIQSSMGAFMRIKVLYAPLSEVVLFNNPKRIYGAVLNSRNIYREILENGLIVIGNEANGISDLNRQILTDSISIPSNSSTGAESLNAAMAASIITSEFFRQLGGK
jgi:RNA methyltransferase, TrmH family